MSNRYRRKKKGLSKLTPWLLLLLLIVGLGSCADDADTPVDPTIPTISLQDVLPDVSVPDLTIPEDLLSGILDTDATEPPSGTEAPAKPNTSLPPENSSFEIRWLDVGQASSALVLCDGQAMLIDAGDNDTASFMYSYLKKHNIDYLDYLVISHGHADHVGGASSVLNAVEVGTAYCSVTEYDSKTFDNFVKYLGKQEKSITVPSAGDSFYLGSSLVEILGPVRDHDDEPNNTSIILRITYGNTRFLFSGDAEQIAENDVLDAGYDISSDVITVGHHGSYTSSGYRWLREADAEYAVISCGKNNEYGHPHEEVLSRLRDADLTVFRTDLQGEIICRSDGYTLSFTTEKNANADTLAGAGAGGNHSDESDSAAKNPATEAAQSGSKVTYIVNTNTGKFHEPSCSSVDQMAEKNKLETTTSRDELISQGYSPCGRCKP